MHIHEDTGAIIVLASDLAGPNNDHICEPSQNAEDATGVRFWINPFCRHVWKRTFRHYDYWASWEWNRVRWYNPSYWKLKKKGII